MRRKREARVLQSGAVPDIMDLPQRVVIVGAGSVGLAAAVEFACLGIETVVLDDDDTVSAGSRAI